jgi:hypothetical protein
MTHLDLERELRNHYRTLDAGSPVRVTSRVADALDRAPAHRWTPGTAFRTRWARVAGIAAAAAAVLAVATLPLWSVHFGGPVASATASHPDFGPGPAGTYSLAVADAEVYQAGMTKSGVVWATFGRHLSISADHGRTWRDGTLPTEYAGDLPPSGTVAVVDADHVWFIRSGSGDTAFTVFRSSDGGTTWQSAALPAIAVAQAGVNAIWPAKLDFVDASVGFAFVETSDSGAWNILRTEDGGVSWKLTGTAPVQSEIVAVDANVLWAHNSDNGTVSQPLLQVTRDAGATWATVSLPGVDDTGSDSLYILDGPTGGVQFLSPNEGYLAVVRQTGSSANTSYETLYFGTTDGGRSWSQVTAAWPQAMPVGPVVLDAKHWYQLGMGQFSISLGMGTTSDGWKSWSVTAIDNNWPAGVQPIAFWTVDGQNGAALASVNNGGAGAGSLFLTWDGGMSWRPADFSAR